jgi:O-acetyl-ADP-ribose deacetylase (regulator of RNase III)
MYKEIEGDLITMALEGNFDVIAQGVNCFCTQKKGLAVEFVKNFRTDQYEMEQPQHKGDINKLGTIEYDYRFQNKGKELIVVNCYTQYSYAKKGEIGDLFLDYDALKLCVKKMNHIFKGKKIGLPKIGAGLAGGDWALIQLIIETYLKDCEVTVVNFIK